MLASMCHPCKVPISRAIHQKRGVINENVTCSYCKTCDDNRDFHPHKFAEKSCPKWNEAMQWYATTFKAKQHDFFLPCIGMNLKPNGKSLQVHRQVWKDIFNLSINRVATIFKCRETMFVSSPEESCGWIKNGGHNQMPSSLMDAILAAPTRFPCITSHYATVSLEVDREYRYSADLSLVDFWKNALEHSGVDNEFVAQAKRLNYWPTFDRKAGTGKECPDYSRDVEKKQLKPSFSYTLARRVRMTLFIYV